LGGLLRAEAEVDVHTVNRKFARALGQCLGVNAGVQLKTRHVLAAVRAGVRHVHQREAREAIRLPS
jgi:hypothetical protein